MADAPETGRPEVVRTVVALRRLVAAWRRDDDRVAMVPTMGALHDGHLALVAEGRRRARRIVVSIFVNPTQFGPSEDFSAYPRMEERDIDRLTATVGADAVFAPSAAEMYPHGFATTVTVKGPAEGLESDFRPHFFAGVATVVSKLLLSCLPDFAVFGEKDYQQLAVVRRMVADLNIPVEIVGLPTVRDADGLALSSRNAYLSDSERLAAPALHAALEKAASALRSGEPIELAVGAARVALKTAGFRIDYVAARNALTLAEVADPPRDEPIRLLAAAWLGRTRLIDNIAV